MENLISVVSMLKGHEHQPHFSTCLSREESRGKERSKEWVNCLPFQRAGLENISQLTLSIQRF